MYLIGICGSAARPSVFANAASSEVRIRTVLLKSVSNVCRLQLGTQLGGTTRTIRAGETSLQKCDRKKKDNGLYLCLSRGISRKGNGNPLQYSCLENSMDRGADGLQSIGLHGVRHG